MYSQFKTSLFITSFALLCFHTMAQKIDLDRVSIKNEFIRLPENGKLINAVNYSVMIDIDSYVRGNRGYTGNKVEGFVELKGYGYSDQASDFTYYLIVGKPSTLAGTVSEKKVDIKNSAGQMVTVTKYVGTLRQAVPTTLLIKDNQTAAEVYKREFGSSSKPFELTQEFDTKALAESFITTKDGTLNATISNNFQEKLDSEVEAVKRAFNIKKDEDNDVFWKVDLDKAPEYASLNADLDKAKLILEKQSYNADLNGARTEMAGIISSWQDGIKKIQIDEKKAKKLRYAYLINIAKSQYWLDLLDDCEKTCQAIIDNDYDKGDGKDLLAKVKEVRAILNRTGAPARRFYRKGFEQTTRFEFGSMAKHDMKEIQKSMQEVQKSGAELKKLTKDMYVRKTIKDSIRFDESDLSDLRFINEKGEEESLNHRELEVGFAALRLKDSSDLNGYVYLKLRRGIGITTKLLSFLGLEIEIHPNRKLSEAFTLDSTVQYLKSMNNKTVNFVNTKEAFAKKKPDGGMEYGYRKVNMDDFKNKPTLVSKAYYQIQRTLVDEVNPEGVIETKNNATCTVQFVEAIPISLLSTIDPKMPKKGYLVTMKFSQMYFEKNFYKEEGVAYPDMAKAQFKDIKCTFILMGY